MTEIIYIISQYLITLLYKWVKQILKQVAQSGSPMGNDNDSSPETQHAQVKYGLFPTIKGI